MKFWIVPEARFNHLRSRLKDGKAKDMDEQVIESQTSMELQKRMHVAMET